MPAGPCMAEFDKFTTRCRSPSITISPLSIQVCVAASFLSRDSTSALFMFAIASSSAFFSGSLLASILSGSSSLSSFGSPVMHLWQILAGTQSGTGSVEMVIVSQHLQRPLLLLLLRAVLHRPHMPPSNSTFPSHSGM